MHHRNTEEDKEEDEPPAEAMATNQSQNNLEQAYEDLEKEIRLIKDRL